jgi:Enoyl-CoA hydratase/isomerase
VTEAPNPVIRVGSDGPLRIVTLGRPDTMNAFAREMQAGLPRVLTAISQDREARAVVLTGAGSPDAAFQGRDPVVGHSTSAANVASSSTRRRCHATSACTSPISPLVKRWWIPSAMIAHRQALSATNTSRSATGTPVRWR